MKTDRVYKLIFASIYPLYIKKVESKGRTKEELDIIIYWLTGFDEATFKKHLEMRSDLETFYNNANINPNADKITGMICGYRVEEIEDPVIRKMRYMDKLVDELAKGKALEKILRK